MSTTKNENLERLLSTGEAATLLGMSVAWLIKTRWAGGGPKYLKLGKSVRYRHQDLADYIERTGRAHTSEPAMVAK